MIQIFPNTIFRSVLVGHPRKLKNQKVTDIDLLVGRQLQGIDAFHDQDIWLTDRFIRIRNNIVDFMGVDGDLNVWFS